MLGGGCRDLAPPGARGYARASRARIDGDLPHPPRAQEDGVVERGDRARVVAGPLRGDPHAVVPGEAHGRLHVDGRLRKGDRRGALVDGEVQARRASSQSACSGDTTCPASEVRMASIGSVFVVKALSLPVSKTPLVSSGT